MTGADDDAVAGYAGLTRDAAAEGQVAALSDHVVICNANRKVKGLVEELHAPAEGKPLDVVLLDPDPALWRRHPDWRPKLGAGRARFITISGRPADTGDLARAGIKRARVAVILAEPRLGQLADARSTLVAMAVERESPQVHTIMELIASVNRVHLRATEINEVVCRGEVAERLIAQSCITPGVKNVFAELLSAAGNTCQIFLVDVPRAADGSSYRQLVRRMINDGVALTVCGFVRLTEDEHQRAVRQIVVNPPPGAVLGKDTPLRGGQDQLVVISRRYPSL